MWLLDRKDVLPDYSLEKSNAFNTLIPIPFSNEQQKKPIYLLKKVKTIVTTYMKHLIDFYLPQ